MRVVGLSAVSTECGQNQCCCRYCRLVLVYTGATGRGVCVLGIYVQEDKLIFKKKYIGCQM